MSDGGIGDEWSGARELFKCAWYDSDDIHSMAEVT
jgi:hypothetical protein